MCHECLLFLLHHKSLKISPNVFINQVNQVCLVQLDVSVIEGGTARQETGELSKLRQILDEQRELERQKE